MADEGTPLLPSRSGGGGRGSSSSSSSNHGSAAEPVAESPEPALKRPRRDPTESAGPGGEAARGAAAAAARKAETAPLAGSTAAAAAKEEEEEEEEKEKEEEARKRAKEEDVAAAAAAAPSVEPGEAAVAAVRHSGGGGSGEGWTCAEPGSRRRGLDREGPPPHPPHPPPRWLSQGVGGEEEEEEAAAPAGDSAETAIGCGAAQCSNGAEEEEEEEEGGQAAPHPGNIVFSDEIIANGFHSCESDEDDRASHASSSDWTPRPRIGPYTFVQQHLMIGTDPRAILKDLLPETVPPPELDDMTLWQIVINILSEPPKRKKRKDINTLEDAVKLLHECKKIIVLTGAGVSVSCGIPDFRSRDGIYARLAVDFPDLPDPQAMFDIEYFRKDPRPFFKFAKEIYPGQFQPSLCHKFIALLDKEKKLLRNYTQNIDTLEQVAGIQRIIQCHGSFATASCLICKYKVDCEVVRADIFNQVVPRCPRCPPDEPLAIIKPEIVFFGENLPEQFHRAMKYDKDEVDLLIVIGSSLKVRPVALIPSSIPHEVPQILINREPLPHLHFDVELLGDCDVIINELCHRLGGAYAKLCNNSVKLSEITEKPARPHKEFEIHSVELPPTPLNISEYSSSPERIVSQDSQVVHSEHSSEFKVGDSELALESKEHCVEEKLHEVQNCLENTVSLPGQLEESGHVKEHGSNQGENKDRSEKTSIEALRKCWVNRCPKEQISKRLDGTQYLFVPPNRYIFHGAEVYSDSEDDVISSSSCGSSSDSGSCHSPSLEIEDESEIEEFYNGVEEDAPGREDENGFGEDGIQDSVDESVPVNESTGFDHSADKL